MENIYLIVLLVGLAAFLYASVGHGGASSYLTILAFSNLEQKEIKITTLVLNILVAGIAMFQYYRHTKYPWKQLLILIIGSIPMAFLGGKIDLEPGLYKQAIGLILIFPILQFSGFFSWAINKREDFTPTVSNKFEIPILLALGLSIGFISGLIGIGGGIILSPIILYLGWLTAKETAGLSAGFIVINSISGLMAQIASISKLAQPSWIYLMAAAGFFGFIGSKIGAEKFNNQTLKRMLALVLLIASIKLIFGK